MTRTYASKDPDLYGGPLQVADSADAEGMWRILDARGRYLTRRPTERDAHATARVMLGLSPRDRYERAVEREIDRAQDYRSHD